MDPPAICAESLSVWRGRSHAAKPVLESLSFCIGPRERVALIGPNGAGKTSLLLALIGAVPFDGTIRFGERPLTRENLAAIRRELGFVFSDPQDQLFLHSVYEEVAFGLVQRGMPATAVAARATDALSCVGLTGFEQRAPSELSLGEQRRLAIATALASGPEFLLLDEPTAGLDPRARRSLIQTMSALRATVICATHDLDAALDLKARAILLANGRIVADGPAEQLLVDEALLDAAGLELPLSLTRSDRQRL
jgi:cobalt/nickel transport system ATP-binding protein